MKKHSLPPMKYQLFKIYLNKPNIIFFSNLNNSSLAKKPTTQTFWESQIKRYRQAWSTFWGPHVDPNWANKLCHQFGIKQRIIDSCHCSTCYGFDGVSANCVNCEVSHNVSRQQASSPLLPPFMCDTVLLLRFSHHLSTFLIVFLFGEASFISDMQSVRVGRTSQTLYFKEK